MFYYAFIDESNTVTGVYSLPSVITAPGYIAITEQQYNDSQAGNENSLIGKIYNAETNEFTDPIIWSCNASEVEYKDTETSVEAKLDEIDATIAGLSTGGTVDAYTKAETDTLLNAKANTTDLHAHDNKTVLDGITAEKVASWDAGTGLGDVDLSGYLTESEAATTYAEINHNHDNTYATVESVNGKADSTHNHDTAYAPISHAHDGYASSDHTHSGYAETNHTHDGYATTGHTHSDYITATTYANGMNGKADTNHTHTGYAASSHTHSGYASSSHSHNDYLSTSGGTVSGNLNVTGIVRVNGQQALYDSGSMVTLSTNNRQTMIAGSAIYSKVAISVSSDERLKENIESVETDKMIDFINGIDVKSFNYIGNDEKCIGAIAQQVQEAQPEIAEYFVREGNDGYLTVKTSDLVFPLITCVQKLTKRIEELENK